MCLRNDQSSPFLQKGCSVFHEYTSLCYSASRDYCIATTLTTCQLLYTFGLNTKLILETKLVHELSHRLGLLAYGIHQGAFSPGDDCQRNPRVSSSGSDINKSSCRSHCEGILQEQ